MRRYRRSSISSFFYGVLIASGTAGGLLGTHMLLAPPSPDQDLVSASAHEKSAPVVNPTVSAGVEKWARQVQPAPQSEPGPVAPKAVSPVAATAPTEPKLVSGPTAATGEAQRALARNIQRELKRVGCYKGEVSGEWSADTRAAMKSFNDTVRVQFPVNAPDYILLTLLQGQTTRACGGADPSIMAKAPAPKQVVRPMAQRDPVVVVPEPRTVTVVQPRSPSAVAQLPPSASQAQAVPGQVEPLSIPTAAPLLGRMSIGAPVPRTEPVEAMPLPTTRAAVSPVEQDAVTPPRLVSPPREVDRRASPPARQASTGSAPTRAPAPPSRSGQGIFTSISRDAP